MRLFVSSIILDISPLDGENPLPRFCSPIQDRKLTHNGTFSAADERMFGFQTGKKVLPYKVQDRYTRHRELRTIKTIVLENENLKAVFLPEYGARLYSLFDKKNEREILFTNEMLQFGNLGQRDAWFSGGIEFNFGHYGHSHLSCSPMFAAAVKCSGYSALRFYEYERATGALYRMDFHLPDGAKTLDMFVRLETLEDEDVPTYWWTNAAVRETPGCRVFSNTDEVLYMLPREAGAPDGIPCFAAGNMPVLFDIYASQKTTHIPEGSFSPEGEKRLDRKEDGIVFGKHIDCSYPANIDYSCEYFFKNNKSSHPWEAVAYEDGRMFFEASTQPLRYRKMFCWGNHRGGRRWQSFLNAPDTAKYIEVQAGIAPTQLHGEWLMAGEPIEFTQSFGECAAPKGCLTGEWAKSKTIAEKAVRTQLSHNELLARHERYRTYSTSPVGEMLHLGSGWGAVEFARADRKPPLGLSFPAASVQEEQLPWLTLLERGALPKHIPGKNAEWMTGKAWRLLLENSLKEQEGKHWESLLHLGIMHMENLETEKARRAWEESLRFVKSACALRNLSQLYRRKGDLKQAIKYMERAFKYPDSTDIAYHEEHLALLCEDGRYADAWEHYANLEQKSDIADIIMCKAAIELGRHNFVKNFFKREHSAIQEGVDALTDLWYLWQAKQNSDEDDAEFREIEAPEEIDFRMYIP